jgi:hypothetical protein
MHRFAAGFFLIATCVFAQEQKKLPARSVSPDDKWELHAGAAGERDEPAAAAPNPSSLSPDKKWEYNCCEPKLVKAGTTEVVLDFSTELDVNRPEEAGVVWASDSKRFAFKSTRPSAAHTPYKSITFYQLRGDKWMQLRSPVEEPSGRTQLAQLVKERLPKSANSRSAELIDDNLKVGNRVQADTAMLYAYAAWVDGSGDREASFLFTLKFDDTGTHKIVKERRMSKKEIEKEQ